MLYLYSIYRRYLVRSLWIDLQINKLIILEYYYFKFIYLKYISKNMYFAKFVQ